MRTSSSRLLHSFYLFMTCAMLVAYAPLVHAQDDAQQIASEGAAVTLFADLEGARLGDRRLPDGLRWGSGKSVSELYAAFIDAGGKLVLCPHCANAAAIGEDALRDGARIGKPDEVAALFLAADKILDY